jgi:hypothetical protein
MIGSVRGLKRQGRMECHEYWSLIPMKKIAQFLLSLNTSKKFKLKLFKKQFERKSMFVRSYDFVFTYRHTNYRAQIETIHFYVYYFLFIQDFLEAKQAISFFVHFIIYNGSDGPVPQPFAVENHQTREKFVVTKATTKKGHNFRISRHSLEENSEWIEEMAKYEDHYEHRKIAINFWHT